MKSLMVLSVGIVTALAAATCAQDAPPETARCFVAAKGNDSWSGKLAAPNKLKTDGPFTTLERAIEAARQVKSGGAASVRIVVGAGTYFLSKPLVLGSQDCRLTIEGAKGEEVVISGGRRVTGWKPWKGKVMQADVSKLDLPNPNFHELYYNRKMQPWARVPNFDPQHPRTGGFLQNTGVVEKDTKTKFRYREGELRPEKWAHPERAWMMFHDSLSYETQYCAVKSVDPRNRIIEASTGVYVLTKGNPFYVCGVLEELDAPGEWCVEPDAETLYFWPPSRDLLQPLLGEKRSRARTGPAGQVVVPALDSAFILKGDAKAGQFVEGVRIARLAIRDCRGRAIELSGARSCTIAACDLRNAEVGVFLGDDTHHCKVVGCDITQTQGDGITIWGSTSDHERVTDHVVDNNYIWDYGWGRIHNRCGGVFMVHCSRCKVTHNHIHDGPRYAIGMDVGGDCEIAHNYCHHVNLVTVDTSIIEAATAWDWGLPMDQQQDRNRKYNWNNSIHHNLLHDSGGWGTNGSGQLQHPLFSWGIYLDTHSSGWHVHDNVIYNTVLGAYMVNGGMDNVFENNLCLDGKEAQCFLETWPKYPMSGNVVQRNIFAYGGKTADAYRTYRFTKDNGVFRSNLIWASGQPASIGGLSGVPRRGSWQGWLKLGQDENSLIADPQFVNPAKRDYRLKPTSPAFKLGFKPIDLSGVGNYASPDRRTWPRPEVKVLREPADYSPPASSGPQQPALRDYEGYSVGEKERNAHVGEEANLGTVAVTDETAASGKHSLRFTDAAGLKHLFVPYVTYPLELDSGFLKAGFDLRWEEGALFVYEWRDDPYNYNLGPNLSVDAQGWLAANDKRLMRLPHGKWVRFDMVCGLGPQATGKYNLTIRLPGTEPQVYKDVACSPKLETLNCVVIMSNTNGPSVFYVDNLELRAVKDK